MTSSFYFFFRLLGVCGTNRRLGRESSVNVDFESNFDSQEGMMTFGNLRCYLLDSSTGRAR